MSIFLNIYIFLLSRDKSFKVQGMMMPEKDDVETQCLDNSPDSFFTCLFAWENLFLTQNILPENTAVSAKIEIMFLKSIMKSLFFGEAHKRSSCLELTQLIRSKRYLRTCIQMVFFFPWLAILYGYQFFFFLFRFVFLMQMKFT